MVKIKIIALLVCLACVLVSGCTSSQPAQAPEAQKPAGPVVTTGQAAIQDPHGPAATITPFTAATKRVNGKSIPYIYERNGRFYAHPVGFVCTEPNPQSQVFIDPNNPGNIVETIWCER